MPSSSHSNNMAAGEVWLQWFSCCIQETQQRSRHQKRQRGRVRIDRSMIGAPTNFQHTGHIGSMDVGNSGVYKVIENQMKSKGGYEPSSTTTVKAC
ncbi:unnamed protein product [Bemisia tabaci]|uniref:CRIB domain-containing protein n=1 Tax=Bemisia tabaci TaxID=7038 RepID=A0A9P0G5J3_BEMTA|nr:PREDICTED: CDC42 small effector protein homolog [Bemisia tabaci]CAH0773344.1 unnamed protein product [Bemisia tabaci]